MVVSGPYSRYSLVTLSCSFVALSDLLLAERRTGDTLEQAALSELNSLNWICFQFECLKINRERAFFKWFALQTTPFAG